MTTHIEIFEDAFAALFRPTANHMNPNATCDWGNAYGTLYETFGEELEYVKRQAAAHIWTWIAGDGREYIASGFHFVNRIGYFLCEVPVPDGVFVQVELESVNIRELPLIDLPPPLPHAVIMAMDRIVTLQWHDEQRHYRECTASNPGQTESHIFHSLRLIRDWLNTYQPQTH